MKPWHTHTLWPICPHFNYSDLLTDMTSVNWLFKWEILTKITLARADKSPVCPCVYFLGRFTEFASQAFLVLIKNSTSCCYREREHEQRNHSLLLVWGGLGRAALTALLPWQMNGNKFNFCIRPMPAFHTS